MRAWLRERLDRAVTPERRADGGWRKRLPRIADWSFALFTLPFSGLAMLAAMGSDQAWLTPLILDAFAPLLDWYWWVLAADVLAFVVPGTLASATMLWRRSRPQWLLLAGLLMLVLYGNPIPLMVGLYSYPAYFSDRNILTGWFALGCLALTLTYNTTMGQFVMMVIITLVVPTVLGLWIGTRRELVARLEERAERLQREQHMKADQAITAERTRIAREMHDVVAHRVSLMVLHAGGLEVSATDERTTQVAGLIRITGREALAELRGILGVLRDESGDLAPTAPQPVLDDLDRLLAEWRGAGMRVRREETGEPGPLTLQVQRTAFRVVQEALTNAAKHATGATVDVRLHYGPDRLEVEVANGPTDGPVNLPPRGGYGLTGLSERVALIGGEINAGPCPDGGWRLRAILPVGREPEQQGAEPTEPAPYSTEEEATEGDPHAFGR